MTNEQKPSAGQPHSMRTHNAQAATGVMPTFLIIGAARSGTTALYTYLSQHPMVFMSPQKEPNFFAFEGERLDFRRPGDDYMINRSITDPQPTKTYFAVLRARPRAAKRQQSICIARRRPAASIATSRTPS